MNAWQIAVFKRMLETRLRLAGFSQRESRLAVSITARFMLELVEAHQPRKTLWSRFRAMFGHRDDAPDAQSASIGMMAAGGAKPVGDIDIGLLN